jgi:ArsR family transcriptional regulator
MKQEEIIKCDCDAIDKKLVSKVKKNMPDVKRIVDTAEFFGVFADGTRIKILCALCYEQMCVCDIAVALNMTKSSISHHLKILKQARLVQFRKEGKRVCYFLCDSHIKNIIKQGFEHIGELYD